MNRKGKIVLRISKPGKEQSRVVLEIPRVRSKQKKSIVKHAWDKSKELDQYMLKKIKAVHSHVAKHAKKAHETIKNHVKLIVNSKKPVRHHGMSAGMKDFLLGVLIGIAITALFILMP